MYSVEDLLISHGYKLPRKHSPPPAPRRAPGEGGPPYGYPSRSSSALGSLTSASGSTSSNHRDLVHSHGRSVLADPGFCDTQRGVYVQPHSGDRGISYWKRRGQDFSALLDYADGRVPMGMQRAEGRSMTARERELALQQWRLAAERRQHGEVGMERWAQQQQQYLQQEQPRRPRTAEGAVPPRTKAKSQSLPRMALPTGPPPGGRSCLSAAPSSLHLHDGGGWMVNPVPQARARQSRPPRPPSYEVHQQTRASGEGPMSRAPSRQEYCPSEPPGYMPPPSYRRQPIMGGGHGYRELLAGYMYRNDPYQQGFPLSEGVQWYARQAGTSWPDHHVDGRRSAPCRAVFPVYSDDGRGVVQYIPFDDPRVRHISSGLLTDADKIRNIQNEIPGITVSEQSPDDSAFLSPQESMDSTDITTPCHAQWPSYPDNLSSAPDLNRNPSDLNRNPTDLTSDPTSKRQPVSSRQSSSSDQGFSETITQVKKFEPEMDSKKPARRRQKETMFCLVSVPIAPQVSRDDPDQNNNNKAPSPTVISMVTQPSNQSNARCLSATIPEAQPTPSSPLASMMSRRAPLRRELVDAWSLQARCSGSWPGDQYRNQQTQTGSPEIPRVPPPTQTAPDAPSSDSTTDSGVGTDCCTPYSLPMKGQRSISPSSTSAFSRTSQPGQPSPSRLRSPPTTPPAPQPLPRRSQPLSQPAPAGSQEVFGQFLLKPVGRRPWDAIEELESFNKESQIVLDPTAACQNNLEANHTSGTVPTEPSEHKEEVDKMDISPVIDDWGLSELVPIYKRKRSSPCWSEGLASADRLQREELHERQDIPVPQESLLRDVGLTVYTPHPQQGAPEESFSSLTLTADTQPARERQSDKPLSQDTPWASEVPNPEARDAPNFERTHASITARPNPEARDAPNFERTHASITARPNPEARDAPNFERTHASITARPNPEARDAPNFERTHASITARPNPEARDAPNFERTHASITARPNPEARDAPNFERTHASITARRQRFRLSSEGSAFLTEGPTAFSPDGHDEEDVVLEALLSRGKVRLPSEDLSPLYQVQSASGIPQNESIEERAARILGICVAADSLVLMGQSKEETSDDPPSANQTEGLQVGELVLAVADKPDGTEKEEEADEREEEGEEEKGETQKEVEKEEETAALGETAIPRETTEEGEPNAREEVTTEKWEITEGESVTVEETTESVTAEETTEAEVSIATRQEETGVTGETAASEDETVELSVSGDRAGEEEIVVAIGDVLEEEISGGEEEFSECVVVSAEVVEAGEEEEDGEDIPDEEIQQVSRELAELELARGLEEELIEEASGSPDSCIAIATLEMPEILSIVEEEEDEDAELGMYGTDRRIDCLQEQTEALSYTPLYLTLGHAERKAGVEEEVQLERSEMEEQVEEEKLEEEAIEDVRGAEEERQIKEDGEKENTPKKEMRPVPLPRSTVVKREICLPLEALEDPDTYPTSGDGPEEICLPLEALEDPDTYLTSAERPLEDPETYPTSDSYDPSRVERV